MLAKMLPTADACTNYEVDEGSSAIEAQAAILLIVIYLACLNADYKGCLG